MAEKISGRLMAAILATGLMTFSGVISETAMNVTFPTLMKEFNIDTGTVQWLTTGYLLILALIIPLSSFLKKTFTTKSLFVTASLTFMLGTLMGALAPSFDLLLCGRILQGVGTGVALPLMFNIILTQAPKSRIGIIMGFASLVVSLAPALGPVLAGFVVNSYGWHEIFLILMPLLILSFILGVAGITPIAKLTPTKVNWPDYGLLVIGFSAFIFASEKASDYGWLSAFVLGLFALTIVALGLFVKRSLASDHPLVNLRVFRNKTFTYAVIFILILQLCILSQGYLVPNYSQLVNGESVFAAGLLLLPGTLLAALISPVSGTIYDHAGPKKPILTGAVIAVIAAALYAFLAQTLETKAFVLIAGLYCIGQGFSVGNATTYSLAGLPYELSADGNAALNTLQQLAGAIGTSVTASLVAGGQKALPDNLAQGTINGSQNAFIMMFVLSIIALFSIYTALCQKDSKKKRAHLHKKRGE